MFKRKCFSKFIFHLLLLAILLSCSPSKTEISKNRYIVTSPELAEIIAAIDGTQNIVGVTAECNYPFSLEQIVKVGNFGKVDFEKIISLNPTLVFTSGLEQELLTNELQKLDIPTAQFYPKSIDEMVTSIREIGKLIGTEKRANFVADSLQIEIEKIKEKPIGEKPSVYVEIYNNPIMSVSDKSFVGEVVQTAGGNNIFSELPREYSRVKAEAVIGANPEIIILTCPPEITAESIKNRKGWEVISAIQNNRIYTANEVNPDLIIRATPRVIEGMKILQKLFNEK